MKKQTVFYVLIVCLSAAGFSDSTGIKSYLIGQKQGRIYRINPWINGSIIIGGTITDLIGVGILRAKPGAPHSTVIHLSPEDVNVFDRGAAMQDPALAYSSNVISNWLLDITIGLPVVLIFDEKIRKDALNVCVVYATTMLIMGNVYAWGVGHIDRYRPYVYNPKESLANREGKGTRNSFYAGHVAATATSTFFIARAYQDYNPGGNLVPWLYASACIPPAVMGYYRYRAGMHFPSDIIAGFAAGTVIGIAIPHFHKFRKGNPSLNVDPMNGMGLVWDF